MKTINIEDLELAIQQLAIQSVSVAETKDEKSRCNSCNRKNKYLFSIENCNFREICSKCAIEKGFTQKHIDKIYNYAYNIENQKNKKPDISKIEKPVYKRKKAKNSATEEDLNQLTELYTKGWHQDCKKSMNAFIEKFNPLLIKKAKQKLPFVSRQYDFEDLVSYFKFSIIRYHHKELEKGDKMRFDYSKRENVYALIRGTNEMVLNAINNINSKTNSQSHGADFEHYTDIDEAYDISCKNKSTENQVYEKTLFEKIDVALEMLVSEEAWDVYLAQKEGYRRISEIAEITELPESQISAYKREIKDAWNSEDMEQFREELQKAS